MRSRRFLLLAATLVALNTALWLAPQGLALQRVVSSLFGKNMMRADVTEMNGAEWRLDRGIVVSNKLGVLTVSEADTRVQPIAVSSSTKVIGTPKPLGINAVKPGWHVLVTWPAPSGPATTVLVEKK